MMMNFTIPLLTVVKDSISKTKGKALVNSSNVNENSISLFVQFALWAVGLIVVVGIILYAVEQIAKHVDFLKKLRKSIKGQYFLILIFFPIFYLIYYSVYYLPHHNENSTSLFLNKEVNNYLLSASLTFLIYFRNTWPSLRITT